MDRATSIATALAAGMAIAVIASFGIVSNSTVGAASEEKEAEMCSDAANAYYISEQFVSHRLKAPKTAEFSGRREAKITYLGNCRHLVSAYVDSQNSFGATLRSYYTVIVRYTGENSKNNSEYTLEEISFPDRLSAVH